MAEKICDQSSMDWPISIFNAMKDPKDVLEAVRSLEKKYFPKHESLAAEFEREVKKRNTFLLYMQDPSGQLVAYLMLTVQGLLANITKLAGIPISFPVVAVRVIMVQGICHKT